MANLNTLRGGIAHGSELAEDEEIQFAFERARLVSTTRGKVAIVATTRSARAWH